MIRSGSFAAGARIGYNSGPMSRLLSTSLLLPLLVLLSCAAPEPSSTSAKPSTQTPERPAIEPRNILLLTIDTLRADHLSSYGYVRQTSPNLDRLAAEGVRFDQATAQWPKTGPSMASMFTSTYPKDNNIVRRVGKPVPDTYRLLAEALRDQGYATHAVVANGALAAELGYAQGFDSYRETWKGVPEDEIKDHNHADAVNRLALEIAAELDPEKPYFLWVHYVDPHHPYTPPEPFSDRFQNDEHWDGEEILEFDKKSPRKRLRRPGVSLQIDGRDEHAFYVARYDAEIAYSDDRIGVLLESLAEAGLMENTLTAVTSDHGESLGEHEYFFGHGQLGYETCLRVPFILHAPGLLSPAVVDAPTELIHLAPTLLEAAGFPLQDRSWMQGRSLLASLIDDQEAPQYAFAEAGYAGGRNWMRIVRDERWKLVFAPAGADQRWMGAGVGDPLVLYDLEQDPGETVDVKEQFPNDLQRLKRELSGWWNAEPFPVAAGEAAAGGDGVSAEQIDEGEFDTQNLDEATRENLRNLGYIQ